MKNRIFIALTLFLILSTVTFQQNLSITKFNLKEIKIENTVLLTEANLKKELNSLYGKNLITLKNEEIENLLLKNSFVESFFIKKKYPNTLKIKIYEKKPIAILIDNKRKFYVSDKIDLIKFQDFQNFKNLPYILGNKEEFKILYRNLKRVNFPSKNITNYILYDSKRWDLKTVDKKIIKLPTKNYVKSLTNFLTIQNNKNFSKYFIFDYRIKDQLILK
tara:strand:- start:740 stop:1396 length:657 start_codon:yes stop_codon:yes gene_type:complete